MARGATPVKRGCGTRCAGGIYAEVGLSPYGRPLEDFLIDPPTRVNAEMRERMGIKALGVSLMPREIEGRKVTYILDWVGSEHYQTVADFVEEVRRFGLSRRLPRTLDFSQISGETRLLLLHSKAWIGNAAAYFALRPDGWAWCPKGLTEHVDPANLPAMCASLWWEDAPDGEEYSGTLPTMPEAMARRMVTRKMPSFEYQCFRRPASVEPEYDLAIFASFPLSRLAVVRDPEGGTHEDALNAARRADLPVDLEEN